MTRVDEKAILAKGKRDADVNLLVAQPGPERIPAYGTADQNIRGMTRVNVPFDEASFWPPQQYWLKICIL
jgi:hypothetical protein